MNSACRRDPACYVISASDVGQLIVDTFTIGHLRLIKG